MRSIIAVCVVALALILPAHAQIQVGAGGGGGGGTPGGANTDVQFNNSSAFGGDAGFTYAGTGQVTITNSTVNTVPLTETGYSLTGSGATSLMSLTGTINTSGVPDIFAMHITDTARGAGTTLMNLYGGASGTTSEFKVTNTGAVVASGSFNGTVYTSTGGQYTATNAWTLYGAGDGQFQFNEWNNNYNDYITVTNNATWQFGRADLAAPVAQTFTMQSVVAGTSNTAGTNATFIGSRSTGTGVSGNLIFEVGRTGTTGSTQNTAYPLLTLNAGNATGATVQLGDGTNFTTYDSCTALTTGATGIIACTGSAMRFKDIHGMISKDQAAVGLDKLNVGTWTYKPEYQTQFGGPAEHVSLYADDVEKMDPRCVTYDETGKVHDYYDRCVIAYLVEDRQNMKAEIEDLKRRVR